MDSGLRFVLPSRQPDVPLALNGIGRIHPRESTFDSDHRFFVTVSTTSDNLISSNPEDVSDVTPQGLPHFFVQDGARYRQGLLRGTLFMNGLGLTLFSLFWPDMVLYYGAGVLLGWGYVWSIWKNAHQPIPKIQFAWSVGRMFFVSLAVVLLGGFQLLQSTVVMVGLLSYKWVLLGQMLRSVWAALVFGWTSRNRPRPQPTKL